MSKPVFANLFSAHGRRNRKSFIRFHLSVIALLAGIYGTTFLLQLLDGVLGTEGVITGLFLWFAVGIVLAASVSTLFVTAQRLRDFGQSGFWAVLVFVPILNVVFPLLFCLIPGNEGENAYGPDPLGSKADRIASKLKYL